MSVLGEPRPFTVHVPDGILAGLRERLARTRWPDEVSGAGWRYGTELTYLRDLCGYWRERYDWRSHEARLNAFPQFTVPLAGVDLHFIHERGMGPDPLPLLVSHGWPGSVWEFHQLIPRLTDPARFGGDPGDAFTVVAPSLPGYGFSFRPGQPRFGVPEIAGALAVLMTDVLGYRRFGAQGGDWGSYVSARLAADHPARLAGIHLNLMPLRREAPRDAGIRSPEEAAFWPYYDRMHCSWPLPEGRIDVPTGYAEFPREILHPPRAWAERAFDLRRWTRMPRGGHFAALEAPDLLAEDVRAFFRPLR